MIYCIKHGWHNTLEEPFCPYCFDEQVEEHLRTITHLTDIKELNKNNEFK